MSLDIIMFFCLFVCFVDVCLFICYFLVCLFCLLSLFYALLNCDLRINFLLYFFRLLHKVGFGCMVWFSDNSVLLFSC